MSLYMMKKKKKKTFDPIKLAKKVRREIEIKEHGKQISFRSGSVFKSKKEYKRRKFKVDENCEYI